MRRADGAHRRRRRPCGSQAAFTRAGSRAHRGSASGSRDDPARAGRAGMAADPGVRAHRNIPLYHRLREPAGSRQMSPDRAVQDQGPPGSRTDHVGGAARHRADGTVGPRFPGTAGRSAKSSCAETSSWRATTTIRTPPRRPSPVAGSIPVMGRWCIPTAMSRFETGSRTSSSAAAKTSRRSKWKACCSSIPPSSRRRSSGCRTQSGARFHRPSSC